MSINDFEDINKKIIGIDEVGRGAWSGPVVACAILLKKSILINSKLHQINDSKKLSRKKRKELEIIIKNNSTFSFGITEPKEIDSTNILVATRIAIMRAYKPFANLRNKIKVDGPEFFFLNDKTEFIIKGDELSITVASASILAKEYRDRIMVNYSKLYPGYDWENNMGYGTKAHNHAIKKNGLTTIHRLSFSPMKHI
ncbi:ribonuclease HII [Rickettsiales bacterium]|nr:ribonuclease HII [Rickettsiales bacterium]